MGAASEEPRAKDGRDVRAGDVNLIPVWAKDVGACGCVASEEGITNAMDVLVGGAAANNTCGSVRTAGSKEDNTMGVHGASKGGKAKPAKSAAKSAEGSKAVEGSHSAVPTPATAPDVSTTDGPAAASTKTKPAEASTKEPSAYEKHLSLKETWLKNE